jgi:Mesyanzhinovviridae DNA helicase
MTALPRDYKFNTQPYNHQLECFLKSRDAEYYALLMEMGTGKTKVIIDTAAWLYSQGKIGAVIVLAPNGVHKSWIADELPKHMPKHVPYRAHLWRSGKSITKYDQQVRAELLAWEHGLRIAAVNIEAITVRRAKDWMRSLLDLGPALLVLDESTTIKTPGAKRSRAATNMGKHAAYRRIMTGTPVGNSPFDVYSQYNFLSRSILDMESFLAFKHYYAEWNVRDDHRHMDKQGDPRQFEEIKRTADGKPIYKHLDELKERIASVSYRKLKKECLDLPEKIFAKRYFELSPDVRKVYDRLRSEFIIQIKESDDPVVVPMVLTRMLRLQQVASGYLPSDNNDDPAYKIPGDNARLETLAEVIGNTHDKVVVWCRFRPECEEVSALLQKEFGKTLRYDGSVPNKERDKVEHDFRFGDAKYLVATQRAGGRGNNWQAAGLVVYYSNTFSLEDRLQTEDRTHRIGMGDHVEYLDLIAMDTGDERIVAALREYKEIADLINGDNAQEWI